MPDIPEQEQRTARSNAGAAAHQVPLKKAEPQKQSKYDIPAFFSSSDSSFQSFCCSVSSCSCTFCFSSALSLSHSASMLLSGTGAADALELDETTSTWFAVAVARHRRAAPLTMWADPSGRAAERARRRACMVPFYEIILGEEGKGKVYRV